MFALLPGWPFFAKLGTGDKKTRYAVIMNQGDVVTGVRIVVPVVLWSQQASSKLSGSRLIKPR